MKNKYLIYLCFISAFVFCSNIKVFSQVILVSSTQSSTGGYAEGGTFTIVSTIGQPTPVGSYSGGTFSLNSGFVSTSFISLIDAVAPTINHNLINSATVGNSITIQAEIIDNIGVSSSKLFFRNGSINRFNETVMDEQNNSFTAVIPTEIVTTSGVEYLIEAIDNSGNKSRIPSAGVNPVRIRIEGEGLKNTFAQPAGSAQNAYRLMSVPLDVSNKNVEAILIDDFGTYDKTKWRFFGLDSNQDYIEYPDTRTIEPGLGYFLIVNDAGKIIDTGPASSIATDSLFKIDLNIGWTFFGNPFAFPISQNSIALENGNELNIRSYSGNWSEYSGELEPFVAYAIHSENKTTLTIDPRVEVPSKNQNKKNKKNILWDLSILASIENARDRDNKILIIDEAKTGYDKYDLPEPPLVGEYVSLRFPHKDWGMVSKNYCVDATPPFKEGNVWEIEVVSNIKNIVELKFNDIEKIPSNFEVWIIDELLKISSNVRENNIFTFNSGKKPEPKKLNLLVGDKNYISKKFVEYNLMPTKFELLQNFPNPFNPSTTIVFALPGEEHVSIKVFDILGKQVATLINEVKPAGRHSIIYEANFIASGVYFYRIEAGSFVDTKKFILLK